jgi:hypothetical protein
MRPILLVLMLAACEKNAADTAPQAPTTTVAAPGAQPTATPSAVDGIELGKPEELKANVEYKVRGTSLTLKHGGASMAHASSSDGKDSHDVIVPLVVSMDGESRSPAPRRPPGRATGSSPASKAFSGARITRP